MSAPHDARFYKFLRAEEAKMTASAPGRRRKLSHDDAQIIARAVNRGAISDERALHYMAQARAGQDISGLDLFAGRDGATAFGAQDEEEDAFDALWPARTSAQHESRQRRRQLATSARRAWTDSDVYDALFEDQS